MGSAHVQELLIKLPCALMQAEGSKAAPDSEDDVAEDTGSEKGPKRWPLTLHSGLQGADGVNLGDGHPCACRLHGRGAALAHISVPCHKHLLACRQQWAGLTCAWDRGKAEGRQRATASKQRMQHLQNSSGKTSATQTGTACKDRIDTLLLDPQRQAALCWWLTGHQARCTHQQS